jgi:oligopeptide/dipeptide ABC transporter ATP-binding protein
MKSPLLSVDDLQVEFHYRDRPAFQALTGVSFEVGEGEVFGLVGETGCGKTLTGLSVLRVLPPNASVTGRITLKGRDVLSLPDGQLVELRGRLAAMIFQDPTRAFNPVFTITDQINDVLRRHFQLSAKERRDLVVDTLQAVGLPDAGRVARSYPHELSGGMLQRAMIAMALACQPALLIADEPTTSLDVTIAAGIITLLRRLQAERQFSILFITHNLALVAELCDRVAVLYAGRVVEIAPSAELFDAPHHPYTVGLLGALPTAETRGRSLVPIPGNVPFNPGDVVGCAFADRCKHVMAQCRREAPPAYEVSIGHRSACYLSGGQSVRTP